MPLISLRALLDHAAEHQYAVPAFNFCNLEQLKAILEAASLEGAPAIVQVSSGGRAYADEYMIRGLVESALRAYPQVPVVWHQDHAHSIDECYRSIQMGYTSVMMDGSLNEQGQPNDLASNIEVTLKVKEVASRVGVSVEGEIGCLGRIDAHQENNQIFLTDVAQAKTFIEATQVDALAVAIGTSHGAYKFSQQPTQDVLAMARLQELHQALPGVHFVLHGSSSVPQKYLEIIRECGGDIPETYGVPVANMQQAVKWGVRKFNIDTDLRIVSMAVMRQTLLQSKACLDPRKVFKKMMSEVTALVRERYQQLNAVNRSKDLLQHTQQFFFL